MRLLTRLCLFLLLTLPTHILSADQGTVSSGIISGTVRDQLKNQPIAGANVYLEGLGRGCPSVTKITGEKGDFHFSELPPGNYRVSVFKQGYKKVSYGETIDNPIGEEIVLISSQMSARINVILPPGAQISGHVYDSTGRALAGCNVTFDPVEIKGSTYFTRTDSTGYYWVSDLPADFYRVSARKFSDDGKLTGNSWYHPGTFRKEEAEHVDMQAGRMTVIDLYFPAQSNAIWKGKVRGPEDEPVANVEIGRIQFLEKTTSIEQGCWTNNQGECSLLHLEEGEYWFFIQAAPEPYAVWFDPTKDAEGKPDGYSKPVQIRNGQPVTTEFRLTRGRRIEGRFHHADGNRIDNPGMSMHFSHQRRVPGTFVTLPAAVKRTAGDTFTVYGVHPGLQYQVGIWSEDTRKFYYPVRVILDGVDITDSENIQVPNDRNSRMEIYFARAASIAGTGPLHQVWGADWIRGPSFPQHMYHSFTALAGAGKFLFRGLPAGTYRIHPLNLKQPYAEVTVAAGETKEIAIPSN